MQSGGNQEHVDEEFDVEEDREAILLNAIKSLEKGSIRKATRTLTSNGVAPDTQTVRQQLIAMNPPRSQTMAHTNPTGCAAFTKNQVRAQINSMNRDSSPGPSGFTINMLKKLGGTERGLSALTDLVNRLLNGYDADKLTGSRLVPLIKTRNKVRPVAVGEVLLRLAARCIGKRLQKDFSQYFRPMQFGVKEPQGTETIIHRVRQDLSCGSVALNVDISNAFNSISREQIRQQVAQHFPSLLPYFQSAYTGEAPLYYKGEVLTHSLEGVRQGDPLGPALFALGLHPVLQSIREDFPDIRIYAYLDDVTFTGEVSELSTVFTRFRNLCENIGLQVNMEKSNIIPGINSMSSSDLPSNLSGVTLCPQGSELLGAPIGTAEFENACCRRKIQDLRRLLLVQTEKSIPCQYRFLLLKDSVLPTINYLLRTVPPNNRILATEKFDEAIQDIVKVLLGGPEWGSPREIKNCRQIYLPLRYGGLGLTLAKHVSVAAYLASTWEAGVQLEMSTRKDLVGRLKAQKVEIEEDWLFSPPPSRKQQATISGQIHDARFHHWLEKRQGYRQLDKQELKIG
jgi:hypothetical protein